MRIICLSDQHGHLPKVPKCDLLLIAGDICPLVNHNIFFQGLWLRTTFLDWINSLKARKIVFIAGNHDFVFEKMDRKRLNEELLSAFPENCQYLQDEATEFDGLKIYGTPWQPEFCNWAFNLTEPKLKMVWDKIPSSCDILVTHGPPKYYGDFVAYDQLHVGSPSLLERVCEIQPKLHVFGHIHPGRGTWKLWDHATIKIAHSETILANVTVVNEKYQLVHQPMEFEIK